jgi:hypothetical protein
MTSGFTAGVAVVLGVCDGGRDWVGSGGCFAVGSDA